MHCLLIKNWLPIASNNGKSKLNQKDLEIIKPHKKICVPCPRMNASLLGMRRNKGTERDICWLNFLLNILTFSFSWSHAAKLIHSHANLTMTLLTWFICINDSAASMSNKKTCSGSKPHTLEQEALVPKFLDVHHVFVKTFRKTHYLIRCDCFFLWKVRNIYMNSMNIRIPVLIEFACL